MDDCIISDSQETKLSNLEGWEVAEPSQHFGAVPSQEALNTPSSLPSSTPDVWQNCNIGLRDISGVRNSRFLSQSRAIAVGTSF